MTDKQIEDAAMERFPDLPGANQAELIRMAWIQGVKFGLKHAEKNPGAIHIPGPLHFQ